MKLNEYATHDGLGLAELVRKKKISAKELTITAATAIDKANPEINCVVETYPDRIEGLDERSLGKGPFHGVPFLIKDVFGHEKGRKIEFGSRLCKGMVADTDSNVAILLRKAGVNIIGRSSAPEYSMAGTSEGLLYGNASTPWKRAGLQAVRPGGPGCCYLRNGAAGAWFRYRWFLTNSGELLRWCRLQAFSYAGLGWPDSGRGRLRLFDEFYPGKVHARCRSHAGLSFNTDDGRSVHHPEA